MAQRYTKNKNGTWRDTKTGKNIHSKVDPNVTPPKGDKNTSDKGGKNTSDLTNESKTDVKPWSIPKVATLDPAKVGSSAKYDTPTIANTAGVTARDMGPAAQAAKTQVERVQLDRSGDAAFRQRQLGLAEAIQARIDGRAPSVAEMNLREGTNRAIAQQSGFLASQRLRNPAQAARLAMLQGAGAQQQAVLDSSRLRMAEQIEAQNQMRQLVSEGRGQELAMSSADATLAAQAAQQQASLDQSLNLENAGAVNTRTAQQAELALRGDLANQQTDAARATAQAQLTGQVSAEQAARQDAAMIRQAELEQAAATTNAAAVNARNSTQAQLATGLAQTQTQAGAQVQSAQIGGAAQVNAAGASAAGAVNAAGIRANTDKYIADLQAALNLSGGAGSANSSYDQSRIGAEGNAAHDSSQYVTSTTQSAIDKVPTGGAEVSQISSDKTKKTEIKKADPKIEKAMDELTGYEYQYKDQKKDGEGKQLGVMAQDLDDSEVGKHTVEKRSDGLYVNPKRAITMLLAMQANLNKRLRELEAA